MCGILFLYGGNSNDFLEKTVSLLKHRGPDDVTKYTQDNYAMAFTRLAINGSIKQGRQPHDTGRFMSMINGEIYNAGHLAEVYRLKAIGSDTEVVGLLFNLLSIKIINFLDGFYSGIIFDKKSNKLYTVKDYLGKKGLFLVRKDGYKIITSELKSVPDFESFEVIPKGICEIDLNTWTIKEHSPHINKSGSSNSKLLPEILFQAVKKRIPKRGQSIGVFLSGGLDSSILASIVNSLSNQVRYYILADAKKSIDYINAMKVIEYLQLQNIHIIPLPTRFELPDLISKVVRVTESYNPSIISNGICSYLLSKAAKRDSVKVIFSGEGADEMFGGYRYFDKSGGWKEHRKELLENLHFTELRRLDLSCMENSIEARFPYLDRQIFNFVEHQKHESFYKQRQGKRINKYILRKAFKDSLPSEIIWREKVSSDVGTGIRKLVVDYLKEKYGNEKEGLLKIWKTFYSHDPKHNYFHSYPTFDKVISERGIDHKK